VPAAPAAIIANAIAAGGEAKAAAHPGDIIARADSRGSASAAKARSSATRGFRPSDEVSS
ncbi:hypothetical protein INO08_15460, partial [Staphylococcus aureus]|nr:hypothetical protein [Staphylococcus aureus]